MAALKRSGKRTSQITWDDFKPREKPKTIVRTITIQTKAERKKAAAAKTGSVKTAAVTNVAGVKVGDIFYTSWGYDQTNINVYQVVGITSSGCYIRPILCREVKEKSYTGSIALVPSPNHFNSRYDSFITDSPKGTYKKTMISSYDKKPYIKLSSFAYAHLYKSGQILYETAPGYGH